MNKMNCYIECKACKEVLVNFTLNLEQWKKKRLKYKKEHANCNGQDTKI